MRPPGNTRAPAANASFADRLTINISSGPPPSEGRMMTSVAAGMAPSGKTSGGAVGEVASVMVRAITGPRRPVILAFQRGIAGGRGRVKGDPRDRALRAGAGNLGNGGDFGGRRQPQPPSR